MPNFLTRTFQKITESFAGPRTYDKELIQKLEELDEYDKAMKKLKNVITNYSQSYQTILSLHTDLSQSIGTLYKNEDFRELADIMVSVHSYNTKQLQSLIDNTTILKQNVNNWENFFEEIRDISKLAEESRKVYDHYEKKLEKLEDKKIEMLKEGKFNESCSFFKIIVRNEDKYMKSKEDYINKAITTYDAIERLNTDMYFVVSPVLLSLFNNELKIYESISNSYCAYRNMDDKFNRIKALFIEKNRNKKSYNPLIFMKNPNIDEKFVKLNENSFHHVRVNSEECKVNLDLTVVDKEKCANSNVVLINFDDAYKSESSDRFTNDNDIFANFQIYFNADKGTKPNKDSKDNINKFFLPAKRDSVESSVSRLSKFPTYKSIIADYNETNEVRDSGFGLGKIINSNTNDVCNTENNPPEATVEINLERNIDFLTVLEKSSKDANPAEKRKNTNRQLETVDPFEGLY